MGLVTDTEQWVTISANPNYEVSNLGRVRNRAGRVLRRRLNKQGYPRVRLYESGRVSEYTVHRLVMRGFGPPPPSPEHEVRHWDDDPLNCTVDNLLWGTHSENIRDSVRNGSHNYARRTHCPRGHELSGRNLLPNKPNGHRQCYACHLGNRRKTEDHDLIYRDLMNGWRPIKGRKQIEPGSFRAEESPESL